MVALHATDPASIFLSSLARLETPSLDAVADALYEERSVARVLAMRRTLFVVPVDDLAMVERSSTDAVAANERKRLQGFLADSDVADPTGWLADAFEEVAAALERSTDDGGLPARTITSKVPRLATKIVLGAGTKHAATAGATSRVLAVMANEGALMRGRPAGQWTGRQYTWHLRSSWLGDEPATESFDEASASTELVRRWLQTFGPGTFDDLKWWTGWKVTQLKRALGDLDVCEVDLDGRTGLLLETDLDAGPDPDLAADRDPWVALLPSLDPTPMGWKERDWYLGPHKAPLFDRFGNVGPTIWADGRIVGGWGQRPDGEIVTRLLEPIGAEGDVLLGAETERLQTAIGDTVVKPSFPTPLQKELAG